MKIDVPIEKKVRAEVTWAWLEYDPSPLTAVGLQNAPPARVIRVILKFSFPNSCFSIVLDEK